MGMNIVEKIDRMVPVKHALISVSDKRELESFIPELIKIVPDIKIISTGGTYQKIKDILGDQANQNLVLISNYTGQPETQGGLVKTLDFKIYLGLLTETYNEHHQNDLTRTLASPIDMVVVNLYPFEATVAKSDVTVEQARGNIDIGGPCMIRASAKNFIRVASVVDPLDYSGIIDEMKQNNGCTSLEKRFELAQKAFGHTNQYDANIFKFLSQQSFDTVSSCYQS
ncbi:IMP cyclohydrolase/ Phosphoribosylaminoimidazolecarboxamide formyltransferase [Candidatus Magnetomorum sp. HK-1]|nr:IMP cyclohydrolase/ Phosphoribosylaminoimidazolecarboxamide formyltransferase [Candidatus Magnetomorum sp. HK-1]